MAVERVEYNGVSIDLMLDMAVGIGGDKWPAADLFCQLCTTKQWKQWFEKLFENRRCIELGSGTGIAGILIDQVFQPNEVIISDLKDHLELIQSNIQRNPCKTVQTLEYDWCSPPSSLGTFDIILVFECVYRDELYEPLIQSLKLLCHQESVILLGLTRSFAKPQFFDLLRSHRIHYTMIPMEALPSTYYSETAGSNVGLFVCTLQ